MKTLTKAAIPLAMTGIILRPAYEAVTPDQPSQPDKEAEPRPQFTRHVRTITASGDFVVPGSGQPITISTATGTRTFFFPQR